ANPRDSGLPMRHCMALPMVVALGSGCSSSTPRATTDAAPTDGDQPPGSSTDASNDGAAPIGCDRLPLCDDFEGAPVGGPPDAARWTVATPNCSGTGHLAIDSAQSHSGARSVRVDGAGGYCNHVFIASQAISSIGPAVYARFFVRVSDALGDGHVS